MTRIAAVVLLALTLTIMTESAYVQAVSLDEVIGGTTEDTGIAEDIGLSGSMTSDDVDFTEKDLVPEDEIDDYYEEEEESAAESIIDIYKGAADFSKTEDAVVKVSGKLGRPARVVIQIIAWAVPIALCLRVAIDLVYLSLPMIRRFMDGGASLNSPAGMPAGGMANGGMMNGGMMNGGMMNGGYGGYNRYGRAGMMNGGMMNGGMMNGGMAGGMAGMASPQQTMTNGYPIVSKAAIAAVMNEGAVGPDGKTVGVFRVYTKDMVVLMIVAPVLLTLAITGVLTNFGFVIGEALVRVISGIDLTSF